MWRYKATIVPVIIGALAMTMKRTDNTLTRYLEVPVNKKKNALCETAHLLRRVLYCHLLIQAEIYIYILDTYRRNDNNRRRKTSLTIYLPLTLLQGFEKGYSRFACERELEIEHNCNILTPNLWPSTLCLSRSTDAQPEALGSTLLGAGFLYCILSASSLDPNSSGLPEGPFGRVWLSLPHLVFNSVRSSIQLSSTSVLTALYNSSTPTRSPTRSLKSNV